jgi:hypothetical protein
MRASGARRARNARVTCLFENQIAATSGFPRPTGVTFRDMSSQEIHCCGLTVSGGFTPDTRGRHGRIPTEAADAGSFEKIAPCGAR